ncbi:HAD family hydrolase [Luteimonas terrae]|uniref:HAD superfamily hydrolase (TIGR01509 family) n=1 Tax=Luteimonas terrae TaxID=1530191 RepID=A0ABU1Y164_9GAMM|nr:HAD family phosphatase [Luteimonas terrae]MDR7194776.1 HAD superfamily hydrolase (TIGR01509 family) [Luteimonas terrae]
MAEIAPLPSRPAAVIFDMDGLMLDSERAILESLRAAAVDHRAEIDPDWWLCLIGHTDAVCRARLRTHIGDSAAAALLDDVHARYVAIAERGLPHRPGIVALLDLLAAHDMPRAVATSTRSPLAQRKLEAAGLLKYFDVVCTSSDVAQPKPAPDVYLLAAERLRVAPSQCLVLEDSPTGVRAALAAGMTAVQVPDLLAPDEEARALGHRIVGSLADAQALIVPWLSTATAE